MTLPGRDVRPRAEALRDAARSLIRGGGRYDREVARSLVYWSVALDRLAESARAAWRSVDPDERSSDGADVLATYRAEADVLASLVFGDMALDDLAWAELARRDALPGERRPGYVPPPWPLFMDVLDAGPDPMRGTARYLDVTLCMARDLLVAHRNPQRWYLPSYSSWGEASIARAAVEEPLKQQAEQLITEALERAGTPMPPSSSADLVDRAIALSPQLDRESRELVKTAFRVGGMDMPPLAPLIDKVLQLVRLHEGRAAGSERD